MLRRQMAPPVSLLTCLILATPPAHADDVPAFPADVRAILDRNCVKCHGPLEQKRGLRLDTVEGLLKGSDNGPVAATGKPPDSKIIQVLGPGADPHMPPKKQLGDDDIAKLRTWVESLGRQSTDRPKSEALPAGAAVPKEPVAAIDHFLSARWQALRLTPAPLCDDRTFVRRVTLDLIGRIPTPEEARSFLYDASPQK